MAKISFTRQTSILCRYETICSKQMIALYLTSGFIFAPLLPYITAILCPLPSISCQAVSPPLLPPSFESLNDGWSGCGGWHVIDCPLAGHPLDYFVDSGTVLIQRLKQNAPSKTLIWCHPSQKATKVVFMQWAHLAWVVGMLPFWDTFRY